MKFRQYINGYVLVELTGYGMERFLNLCKNKEIQIWKLVTIENGYRFCISIWDFRRIRDIVRKTHVKIHIVKKYGLPFYLYRHRKQQGFLIGLLLCVGMIYGLSLFIWDIHVMGSTYYTEDEIVQYIKSEHVASGTRIANVDMVELEKALMQYFDEISWVSCRVEGTQLIVEITETIISNQRIVSENPSDIVATKDCEILSIITRNGTPIAKVNDSVKKGDILISGVIHFYSDSQEVMDTEYICADGDVYGKTVMEYEDSLELQYYEKQYTGRNQYGVDLQTTKSPVRIWNPKVEYDHYDVTSEDYFEKIGNAFYLPFALELTTYREYQPVRKEYSKEEAVKKLKDRLTDKISELREKGVVIIENNVKINKEDSICYAKGTLILKEKIGIPRDLEYNRIDEDTEMLVP